MHHFQIDHAARDWVRSYCLLAYASPFSGRRVLESVRGNWNVVMSDELALDIITVEKTLIINYWLDIVNPIF